MSQPSLESRVVAAAEEALARQGFVTPIDVCLGLGWLRDTNVDDWRHGRVDDLEGFLPVHDNRLIDIHVDLHHWATARGLQRTEGEYISAARGRSELRFLRNGHRLEEVAWRARWMSSDLPDRKRDRITKAQDAPPDLVVIQPIRDWECAFVIARRHSWRVDACRGRAYVVPEAAHRLGSPSHERVA